MPIENRNLTPGTRLVATYKKQHHACIVSAGEDDKLVFTLEDGRAFSSPSAAGSAVMNGAACNGWRFWSVEGEATASTNAAPQPSEAASKPRRSKAKASGEHRAINPASSQKGASEGMTKYFCDSCMSGFEHPTDLGAPDSCPQGHPALIPDAPVTASA